MDEIVDHPFYYENFWRHEPPTWESCYVCGGPTCWVLADIGFTHPECDIIEGRRFILGKWEPE